MEQEQSRINEATGRTASGGDRDMRPTLPEPGSGAPRCNAYDSGYTPDGIPDTGLTPLNPGGGVAGGDAGNGTNGTSGLPIGNGNGNSDGNGDSIPLGSGTLIFQVTTGSGALPLTGAQVTVMDCIGEEGGLSGDTVGVLFSDTDGKTQPLTLPAPSRLWSLRDRPAGSPLPYSMFNAEAELDGYYTQTFLRIPVFDGITSVQQIDLIPLPLSGIPDRATERGQTVDEGAGETL